MSLIDSPSHRPPPPPQGVKCSQYPKCQFISSLSAIEKPGHMNCPENDRHITFIHTRGLTSVSINCIIIIKSLKFKMWRYGIGETLPKKRKHDNDAEKKKRISNMRQNVCGVIYNHG